MSRQGGRVEGRGRALANDVVAHVAEHGECFPRCAEQSKATERSEAKRSEAKRSEAKRSERAISFWRLEIKITISLTSCLAVAEHPAGEPLENLLDHVRNIYRRVVDLALGAACREDSVKLEGFGPAVGFLDCYSGFRD